MTNDISVKNLWDAKFITNMFEHEEICQINKQLMENMNKICRFCLFDNAKCEERPLINLFENFNYEDVEKIQTCLNVKVTLNDKIPPIICQACMEKVDYFHNFLELCSKSEKQLERLYGLNQSCSNTSQDSDQFAPSVNWISDEKLRTPCKTESDYSINYKPERKIPRLSRKKSITLQSGKSAVMLMTQTRKLKEKSNESRSLKGPFSFKCKVCKKKFASVYDQQHHTKTVHAGETLYKCGKCDKIFMDEEKCLQHEKNHKMECKICNSQVLAKNMAMHLHKHAEKFRTKPAAVFKSPAPRKNPNQNIICKICQKMFRSEVRLTAHMKKMHETKKIRFSANKKHRSNNMKFKIRLKKLMRAQSFKCKLCDQQFSALKELKEHNMTNHHDSKKTCPKCRREFLYKKHFDKHILQCFYTPSYTAVQQTSSLPTINGLLGQT